jgi:hypothetical protein
MLAYTLLIMDNEKSDIPCHCKRVRAISSDLKLSHHLTGTPDDYLNLQEAAKKVNEHE